MTQKIKAIRKFVALMMLSSVLTSCIYDDLSDCGTNYRLHYTIQPSQALDPEIASQLTSASEQLFAPKLRAALSPIFTDRAEDIDISFFDPQQHSQYHTSIEMKAHTASYTFYLKPQDYHHVAIANVGTEPQLRTETPNNGSQLSLVINQEEDTIPSQSIGIFTSQTQIPASATQQDHSAVLYMKNCASALVVDRNGYQPTSIEAYVKNTASAFTLSDSTYHFNTPKTVAMQQVSDGNLYGLYAATFPSRCEKDITTQTDQPAYWEVHAIVFMNGKYTKSVFKVEKPLHAGDFKIIKGKLLADGSIVTQTPNVGVSIELNWKPGGNHDINM